MRIEIKNRYTNQTIFEGEYKNMTAAVTEACLAGVDLAGANLTGVNLTRANLTEVNLTGVDLTRAAGA